MRIFIVIVLFVSASQSLFSEERSPDSTELSLEEEQSDFAKEEFVWRYVPRVGLRKFSVLGSMIKDMKDWDRVARWKPWLLY